MILGAYSALAALCLTGLAYWLGVNPIGCLYIFLAAHGAIMCAAALTYRLVTKAEEFGP